MNQMSIRILYHLFCLILAFIFATPTNAKTAQQIAKKTFSSTVLLVMEDSKGQPLSLGSGFLVRGGIVASNLHVVQGAIKGYAKLVAQKKKYNIEGISAVDAERDLVLLKISASAVPSIPLGNSNTVQIGDPVYAVGNSQGQEGTFSQGIISSIREIGADKLLQITAPISPGSSGGPVLNNSGEVIGVSVATFRGGENLNFAIPSNYLKALLTKSVPVKPLAQAKLVKGEKSILANLGDKSSQGVRGGQLRWAYPIGNSGEYSLSLRNQLLDNVRNVYCLVIFYDAQDNPIDIDVVQYQSLIPAGLAKRATSKVDGSVQKITTRGAITTTPQTKVEFRILNFEIME